MGKTIKNILYYGSMIIVAFLLFIGCYYLVTYSIGNEVDQECLDKPAINYCESLNQTYLPNYRTFIENFYCQDKDFNPRLQSSPDIHSYKYLNDEVTKCITRESWYRKYILKER